MTYPTLVPYLKGFHLTLEMWRPDRDFNGWKMSATDWIRLQNHFLDKGEEPPSTSLDYSDAPDTVKIAPRLIDDLQALNVLMEDSHPPLRVVRSKLLKAYAVAFVDASGGGKGASIIDSSKKYSIHMGTT